MITFQSAYTKFQKISGSSNATDLVQAKEDINIGYKKFDAALGRYWTRKQQFANIVAAQKYYQTPVDAVRVIEVSVVVSSGYEVPLEQIRDEHQWRELNILSSYQSNTPTHYFVYGNDQIGLYPTPSTSVTAGLRYVYQPTDIDLTADDYTAGTATISNGLVAITGSGTTWTAAMTGRQFQVTDGSDGRFYEITAIGGSSALTLKTPYVGPSVSGGTYRIAPVFNIPGEYDDAPVDYALARFFEARNNPVRAKYHEQKFDGAIKDALEKYSSSSSSHVITDGDSIYPTNAWKFPPQVG